MHKIHSVKRVAVLRGGPSEEYATSLDTGAGVLSALSDTPYAVEDIMISKTGEWLKNGIVKTPDHALAATDVVFIALHGAYGEDGTVQRILQRLAIPYVGSGPYVSALCCNKMLTKEHLQGIGILMPRHMRVSREANKDLSRIAYTISTLFGPSYVLKPLSSGSSFGIMYAEGVVELVAALEESLQTYTDILVEEFIEGADVTCAVLEDYREQPLYSFPSLQMVRSPEQKVLNVFDAQKVVPANLKTEQKREVERVAQLAHTTLGCAQHSRSDFVVTKDGDVFFLELNTLPSLADTAPYTSALQSVGANTREIVEQLISTASSKTH
ncbi:MAG: D-alanine-D-alanine ligase [Candidatus Azotimanducaceae bacterium]|jgi:D-alanine-D-alanine ligase